jgi:hypothetical protein
VRNECLLHRMQFVAVREAFDGRDLVTLLHHRERHARQHSASVDMNRASSTLSVIAAFLRSGEARVVSQRIKQRYTRLELKREIPSIHT